MNLLVEGVERIAVLRANALSDLLLALPAIDALRRAYPRAKITLLGRDWHVPFLRDRPGPVDSVVAVPSLADSPGPTADLVGKFDLAVQMHGGGRDSNPYVNGLGARVTAGLCTPDAERLDRWIPYVDYQHETMRYLEVAGLVGAAPHQVEPTLCVTSGDYAELREALGEPPRRLVAVHPGAADPRRRWPAEYFAEAINRLGRPAVVTGTAAESDLIDEIAARAPRAIPMVDRLSLGGLAALYTACDVLIANDSGPRHLAAAIGTPTVGIYWCGNLINGGPLSRGYHRPLVSWTANCPICGSYAQGGMGTCGHQTSWLTDVPVEDVVNEAEALIYS